MSKFSQGETFTPRSRPRMIHKCAPAFGTRVWRHDPEGIAVQIRIGTRVAHQYLTFDEARQLAQHITEAINDQVQS